MYRQCKSCTLSDGGQCSEGSFVVAESSSDSVASTHGISESRKQVFICRVIEMLHISRSSAALRGLPSYFLVQVFRVIGTSQVYKMPEIIPYHYEDSSRGQHIQYRLLTFEV
jgi:hypothetical protein